MICWSKKLGSCFFSERSQIYSFLVVMENWNTLNPRQIYQIWWIAQICIFSCYRSMLWAHGVRGGCPSPRRKYNLPGNISFPFPLVLASNYWLVHLSHHITHCFPAKNYWAPFLPPLHDYLFCFQNEICRPKLVTVSHKLGKFSVSGLTIILLSGESLSPLSRDWWCKSGKWSEKWHWWQ